MSCSGSALYMAEKLATTTGTPLKLSVKVFPLSQKPHSICPFVPSRTVTRQVPASAGIFENDLANNSTARYAITVQITKVTAEISQ